MMKQYDSYKDSGVEWIGKIPSHWEVVKLKYDFDIYAGATPKTEVNKYWDGDITWVTPADYKTGDKFITNGQRTITKEGYNSCNTQIVPKGSLIFSKRAPIGTVAISGVELCTNQGCLSCVPRNTNVEYFYYLTSVLTEIFDLFGSGATFKEISADTFANFRLPCPSMEEQMAIANYLDKKCGEIDKAIETQEKRVELLKELRQNIITQAVTRGINPNAPLKDSGVEWIGEVPEHWKIKRIKHCAQIFGRIGFRGYTTQDLVLEGEGPITLSPSNMHGRMNYDSCTYLSWFKYNESPEIQIHNGDVLFVKTGSTYGKSAYVENLPMEATINPQIVVFKDFKDCNGKFFYYLLTTDIIQSQVDNTVIGSTIPTIGQEKIRNYVIPMPPLSEQQEIVSYIESQTARLDKSIEKAEHQIELLQELKQSIITEVVTGKRKVV